MNVSKSSHCVGGAAISAWCACEFVKMATPHSHTVSVMTPWHSPVILVVLYFLFMLKIDYVLLFLLKKKFILECFSKVQKDAV